jgi:uncharacterized membrane protein YuzA (DUF378 family)
VINGNRLLQALAILAALAFAVIGLLQYDLW